MFRLRFRGLRLAEDHFLESPSGNRPSTMLLTCSARSGSVSGRSQGHSAPSTRCCIARACILNTSKTPYTPYAYSTRMLQDTLSSTKTQQKTRRLRLPCLGRARHSSWVSVVVLAVAPRGSRERSRRRDPWHCRDGRGGWAPARARRRLQLPSCATTPQRNALQQGRDVGIAKYP